jgi:hypothetical protein
MAEPTRNLSRQTCQLKGDRTRSIGCPAAARPARESLTTRTPRHEEFHEGFFVITSWLRGVVVHFFWLGTASDRAFSRNHQWPAFEFEEKVA